jgi:hypothetical protein
MFQKQQTVYDIQKAVDAYNAILEKGKQLGLEEAAHAKPVRRSQNDRDASKDTSSQTSIQMFPGQTACQVKFKSREYADFEHESTWKR